MHGIVMPSFSLPACSRVAAVLEVQLRCYVVTVPSRDTAEQNPFTEESIRGNNMYDNFYIEFICSAQCGWYKGKGIPLSSLSLHTVSSSLLL